MAQPATVVYSSNTSSDASRGTLFKDIRFFVCQRIPSRPTFLDTVTRNGGTIVKLEKQSDIIIADHLRKATATPGSISYTWIEASIRDGQLADKEDHRAGPVQGTARPVGALRTAKTSRVPYTKEDDLTLYRWVKDAERRGESILGNTIYQKLEQKNSRHPYQSWRDRWVKMLAPNLEYQRSLEKALNSESNAPTAAPIALRSSPEPSVALANSQAVRINGNSAKSPGSAAKHTSRPRPQAAEQPDIASHDGVNASPTPSPSATILDKTYSVTAGEETMSFDQADFETLLIEALHLSSIPDEQQDEAWEEFASVSGKGSVPLWRKFFEQYVLARLASVRRLSAERDQRYGRYVARISGSPATMVRDGRSSLSQTPRRTNVSPPDAMVTSVAKGDTRIVGASGEPMVIVTSPIPSDIDVLQQEERESVRCRTRSHSIGSPNLKRKRDDASPIKSSKANAEQTDSSKRVRFDPQHSGDRAKQHISAEHDAPHASVPIPGRQQSAQQHTHTESSPLQSASKRFSIWQGDDYVEDDKENLHKKKDSPAGQHSLRPRDALDAFNSNPPHFTLEAVGDSFKDISEVLSESEADDEYEEGEDEDPVKVARSAGGKRILVSKHTEVVDLSSPEEPAADGQHQITSEQNHIVGSTVRYPRLDPSQKYQNNVREGSTASPERFETAREEPLSQSPMSQLHDEDQSTQQHVALYSDDESEPIPQLSARRRFMYSESSDDEQAFDTREVFPIQKQRVYDDTQALLNGELDTGDLMGMPMPPHESRGKVDPADLMGMPLPPDESQSRVDSEDLMGMPPPASSSNMNSSPALYQTRRSPRRHAAFQRSQPTGEVDTQALLESGPHIPDFNVPSPPSSLPPASSPPPTNTRSPRRKRKVVLSSSSQSGPRISSSRKRSPSPLPDADRAATPTKLDAWISRQIRREYDPDLINQALSMTTLDSQLAEKLLDFWAREGEDEAPPAVKGIWTEDEDEIILRGTDARDMTKLELWHGTTRFNARVKYLRIVDAAGDDSAEE